MQHAVVGVAVAVTVVGNLVTVANNGMWDGLPYALCYRAAMFGLLALLGLTTDKWQG
jgi:FtsH-binding integral membrane protein